MISTEMLTYYQLDVERYRQLPAWRQHRLQEHFRDWKWRQDLQRRKHPEGKQVKHDA